MQRLYKQFTRQLNVKSWMVSELMLMVLLLFNRREISYMLIVGKQTECRVAHITVPGTLQYLLK